MTASSLFLDSSVWLGYFLGNLPETRLLIESEDTLLFSSIISIYEVFKRLKSVGKSDEDARRALNFMEENSAIINLNKQIAINAVENSKKYRLHTIDSLIYSTATETKATFITADKDFKETPKTRILEIK